jgi:hypothetical protein
MAYNIHEIRMAPFGLRNFTRPIRTFTLVIACVMAFFLCSAGVSTNNPKKAVQWERWQQSFSTKLTTEAQKVSLVVDFTGPKGKTFRVPAFTDDGKTFHFRAAFPAPGVWQWITICSDQDNFDLHNKKGKVRVKQYQGDNPLYKHGDLKVSDDRRYLTHDDGTPFLWIGDTGWNATFKSTMKEWCDYVDKRVSQGFTVIQISPRGFPLLTTTSFKPDKTIDPFFWQDLEDKIGYANDKGLFVLMVGLGSSWRDLFAENPKNQKFETYIAGRLSSFMVIFSPSFDQLYEAGLNDVAAELKKSTLHLLTQHSGTNYEANLTYRNTPSVDFCGMQSGHHRGNMPRVYNAARTWTLDMWNGSPVKPVINIEAMYDAHGNDNADNWRGKDSRKLGWISWLSGSKGYTYGAGDIPPKVPQGAGAIWKFNKDSTTYDFWRNALDWPSAGEMTVMKNFFKSIEWWRLLPSHELVVNQSDDETLKMVVSETIEKDLLLAYLPDNAVVVLDLKGYSGEMTGKWLNPVNGIYLEIAQPIMASAKVTFTRPDGWEDALLILARQ